MYFGEKLVIMTIVHATDPSRYISSAKLTPFHRKYCYYVVFQNSPFLALHFKETLTVYIEANKNNVPNLEDSSC